MLPSISFHNGNANVRNLHLVYQFVPPVYIKVYYTHRHCNRVVYAYITDKSCNLLDGWACFDGCWLHVQQQLANNSRNVSNAHTFDVLLLLLLPRSSSALAVTSFPCSEILCSAFMDFMGLTPATMYRSYTHMHIMACLSV